MGCYAGVCECVSNLRRFIAESRIRISNKEEARCISALLRRNVQPGDVASLEELFPKPNVVRVFNNSLELLTDNWPTPILKIGGPPREAFAKLEWYNPFSASIKDRTVYALLQNLEGDRIVEVSSGNVAVAMGALGNIMNKKVKIYLPTAGSYIAPLLDVLGVEHQILDVTLTVEALEHLEKDIREGAVHPNQFMNDQNFLVHIRTAVETDWQLSHLGKKPTYVIAAVGTSGHFSALGFYFGVKYGAKLIAVQPSDWIPGIRRVESGMKWLHCVNAEVRDVSLAEAMESVKQFAKKWGLLVGPSSGAVYRVFQQLNADGVYLLVFPDNLFKYLPLLEKFKEISTYGYG